MKMILPLLMNLSALPSSTTVSYVSFQPCLMEMVILPKYLNPYQVRLDPMRSMPIFQVLLMKTTHQKIVLSCLG